MDLIAQALAKREKLKADLERVETFLAIAYELQSGDDQADRAKSNEEKIVQPEKKRQIRRAPAGAGAATADAAYNIIRAANRPMSTRDLLPLIEAHGIEIGGKNKIATLSARLGNDAKRDDGKLHNKAGKWHLLEWISDADNEETADTPTKDAPAASFFSNQEGGETYAAPLN